MTGTTRASADLDQIRELEFRLEEMMARLVEDLERSGERLDHEFVERFRETARQAARQVNESLPVAFPPEAGDEIRRTVIDALTDVDGLDESQPLDAVDRLLLRLEQIRHVLRDAFDESIEASPDDGQEIATKLAEWLPGVKQSEIADLVGVSARTLQRSAKEGGVPSSRMQLVARLVAILRRAWTPEGVVAWFYRSRRQLDGKRPVDVLGDGDFEGALMTLARQGRAGHGS